MSGLKKCHLVMAVHKLLENLEEYMLLSRGESHRFTLTKWDADIAFQDLSLKLKSFPACSEAVMRYAEAEYRKLLDDVQRLHTQLAPCREAIDAAQEIESEVTASQADTSEEIAQIKERMTQLENAAQAKIDQTDFVHLDLDAEVETLDQMARDLEQKIARMEVEAGKKLARAYDARNALKTRISALDSQNDGLLQRLAALEALALRCQETEAIADTLKQTALRSDQEITLYVNAISQLDHQRFFPGRFEGLLERVAGFQESFASQDYEACAKTGPELSWDLKNFLDELNGGIQVFQNASQQALGLVNAAEAELAEVNMDDLKRWTHKNTEIQHHLDALKQLRDQIEDMAAHGTRAEAFEEPSRGIAEIVAALRELSQLATENHARYAARDSLRKAVRKALAALRFDKPTYYFQGTLEDGTADELSDLTIYAHNPAETGNMRLTMNLDGDVSFEVYREDGSGAEQEVTHRDAVACHQTVLDFNREMEASGIYVNMTDWGAAADVASKQDQERVTWQKDDPHEKHASAIPVQERTREREKEQQRARR